LVRTLSVMFSIGICFFNPEILENWILRKLILFCKKYVAAKLLFL
jgi:hypothetical protein